MLRHHSTVGRSIRTERDGLVRRNPDRSSKSIVRVNLTAVAIEKLDALAEAHRQELAHLAQMIDALRMHSNATARASRPGRATTSDEPQCGHARTLTVADASG